jgi:hypothetical protein
MKLLFLSLFFSITSMASNWMPVSKIQPGATQAYQLESDCMKSGEQCLDVGDEPGLVKEGFASLTDVMGDDVENPIWAAESEVESCSGQEECYSMRASKVCSGEPGMQIFVDEIYTKVYCTKVVGYQQKAVAKALVKDLVGWSAHKAAKASAAALEAGISQAQALRQCGERVMALMLVRNQPKGLSTAQVKQLVAAYASIKGLLESGSLVSAKEEIQAVSADGVLVTEGDKSALVAEINKCLGL